MIQTRPETLLRVASPFVHSTLNSSENIDLRDLRVVACWKRNTQVYTFRGPFYLQWLQQELLQQELPQELLQRELLQQELLQEQP